MLGAQMAESDRQISAARFFDSVSPNGQDKVRVPKMADIVADQIRSRIINGELKEGDRLPSEALMLERFGISRPTLREALRVLETEKLISVSRGSRNGAIVHTPKIDVCLLYTSPSPRDQRGSRMPSSA